MAPRFRRSRPALNAYIGRRGSFGILGVALEEDALVLDVGMSVQAAPGAIFSLSYNGQHGSNTNDHGVRAGIHIAF